MPAATQRVQWRAVPWHWWLLAAAVLALGVTPIAVPHLDLPAWTRQVDLEVYRAAGESVLQGRSVYDHITDTPNLLPFTYPPFAAVLFVPAALVPFGVAQVLWLLLQVALLAVICAISAAPLLARCGNAAPVALAGLVTASCWTLPVDDGLYFGQVGVLLTALCLVDVCRRKSGVLVGLAAAIKLTPGLFVVFLLLAGRVAQARRAFVAAALVTVGVAFVLPQASVTYWGTALWDSSRIGSTGITYNGSLVGAAERIGPDGDAGQLVWGVMVALVTAYGLWVATRLAAFDEDVLAVAAVGLLTVLLSPIAWLHHLVWVVPAMLGLVGTGRSRLRVGVACAVWLLYSVPLELPWKGGRWLVLGEGPEALAHLAQSSYTLGSVLLLLAFHLLVVRRASTAIEEEVSARST